MRARDPTLGRFISRDPLGRAPLMGWSDQPYTYAGNNPLLNVDPSGQQFATEGGAQATSAMRYQRHVAARVRTTKGSTKAVVTVSKAAKSRNVEWSRVLKDALSVVYGAVLIVGGGILLGHFIAAQAAFMASVELTMLFGASPFTVVVGLLSLIANGLSIALHSVMDIVQQFVDIPSQVQSMILGVETVIDAIALTLSAVWTVTSAAGLFEKLGKLAFYVIQLGSTVTVLNNIADDIRSGVDLTTIK